MKTWHISACVAGGLTVLTLLVWWLVCVPPYNKPEFETVDNNETAFLIPLRPGDTDKQTHFASQELLQRQKISATRIQIPKVWIQTGWLPATGEYQVQARLVRVNRAPVVREWVRELGRGTSKKNESIDAHSKDGSGINIGFTATAFVDEMDTPKFLYYYRGDTLAHIMDTEFRARVTAVPGNFA